MAMQYHECGMGGIVGANEIIFALGDRVGDAFSEGNKLK